MAVLVKGLYKSYGEKAVLENFSASFKEGAVTCIMGKSGRGKTTLLRLLLGLERADSGEIILPKHCKKSAVFQEDRLCENLSVGANIRLTAPKTVSGAEIAEGLLKLGLPDCIHQPAKELSGGMCRRAALLRALLADWDILFMDEPFKGLDGETKALVIAYTRQCCKNKTVICVTHEESEAKLLGAENIIIME